MPRVTSRVREFRLRLLEKFSEEEFGVRASARRAGISERSWWSAERGENMPSVETAVAIARVLGVTVEQLDFQRVESKEDGLTQT